MGSNYLDICIGDKEDPHLSDSSFDEKELELSENQTSSTAHRTSNEEILTKHEMRSRSQKNSIISNHLEIRDHNCHAESLIFNGRKVKFISRRKLCSLSCLKEEESREERNSSDGRSPSFLKKEKEPRQAEKEAKEVRFAPLLSKTHLIESTLTQSHDKKVKPGPVCCSVF